VPSLAADRDRLRQDRPRGAQDAPRGFPARIGMLQTPALCQPPGRAGPALRRLAPLTSSSLPQSRASSSCAPATCRQRPQRSRDSRLGLDQPRRPIGALPRTANDAHTGRSRPQSQGGSQPPRSNGQAFDEARNPVTAAGRRCYRASGPVRPRWDQAFPCYSPLTGWASGPVAASRPSGEHPPAGGPALLG
jgi:hypothetical protein